MTRARASASCSLMTTPSCAAGCACCSTARTASKWSPRQATWIALRATCAGTTDVLVLDLNMPGGSSLEAIPKIRSESPDTQIVVLTMQQEPAFAREALGSGALGYVLKEAADEELVEAVRRAAAGESYLNPRLGARIASEPPPGPPDDLSEREVDVLQCRARSHQRRDRRAALPVGQDRRDASLPHPAEAAPLHARRAGWLRARPRPRRALAPDAPGPLALRWRECARFPQRPSQQAR